MSIKILTKNSIDNTNIDGARANHFSAGMRSGIVKGAFNEGRFFASASNIIALDTCELRISGHQVVIDSLESITLSDRPIMPTKYSMIAEIQVSDTSVPSFRLFIQPANVVLRQENLFKTNNGSGTYQLRIGNFTLNTNGNITDVFRTVDIIAGGSGAVSDIVFNASAIKLSGDAEPEANIDYNEETGEYDFVVGIPVGSGEGNTDLTNHYTKDETYSNIQIDDMLKDVDVDLSNKIDKVSTAKSNNIAVFDDNGNIKDSEINADSFFSNNSAEVCNGVSWNRFNTATFYSVFGDGWDRKLGHYGCRANSSDDESGLVASLGYSGTYYVEFNVWYIGENNLGVIIRINDSLKCSAEASHVFNVGETIDMSNMFVSLNTTNMLPSGQYDYVQIQSKTTIQGTVYVAPSNGFAMIRGQFSDNAEYFIHDPSTGVSSFYQWLNSYSNGHFPMKKGQEIRLHSLTGNILWADVYFAFIKQV